MLKWLMLLCCSLLAFGVSFWMLDWAIWHEGAYVYYPIPSLWNVRLSKGEIINLAYWQIYISLVIALISAYRLGAYRGERR